MTRKFRHGFLNAKDLQKLKSTTVSTVDSNVAPFSFFICYLLLFCSVLNYKDDQPP